jgi:hypothetical protein
MQGICRGKIMTKKDNKLGISKRKGWYGFVHGYKDYLKNVDWGSIDWTSDKKPKSEEKDKMGKIIQKW